MTPDQILYLIKEIEESKPTSGQHEPDGRFVWPERWETLKRMVNRARSDRRIFDYHAVVPERRRQW